MLEVQEEPTAALLRGADELGLHRPQWNHFGGAYARGFGDIGL